MVGERVLHHCLHSVEVGEVRLIGRRRAKVDDIDAAVYCVGAYSGTLADPEFAESR